jgi:hypothetical protein
MAATELSIAGEGACAESAELLAELAARAGITSCIWAMTSKNWSPP